MTFIMQFVSCLIVSKVFAIVLMVQLVQYKHQRCTEGLIPGLKYHHCGAALNYCNSQGIFDLPGGAANHNW